MEASSDCSNDHLIIHDGESSSDPVIAKLCGTLPVSYQRLSTNLKHSSPTSIAHDGPPQIHQSSCLPLIVCLSAVTNRLSGTRLSVS